MRKAISVGLLAIVVAFLVSSAASQADKQQQSSEFSQVIAESLLARVRDGLNGHSQRTFLSAFDHERMEGYRSFDRQIGAFFDRYESFRVHYNVAQINSQENGGVVLADVDLEGTPAGGGAPVRKSMRLRFTMDHGKQGWKVVEVSPRGFFY